MMGILSYFRAHKERLATIALIFGFVVDIITFRTLNITYALILLAAHLAIVAFAILLLTIPTKGEKKNWFASFQGWLPVVHQYSTGNLLSAFLILYSASASLIASWPFLALVAIAAIGNEALRLEKYLLPFRTTLFFLNLLLYAALVLPVATSSISIATFLVAVIVAAIVFQVFRWMLRLVARQAYQRNRRRIYTGALAVFLALNLLYFTNIIPPIPLTLRHIDFYHQVHRTEGGYVLSDEERGWFETYFALRGKHLRLAPGEDAYVFTSVSAPAQLDTSIVHRFEFLDTQTEKWITKNSVTFQISGGRSDGYRGFSLTEDPVQGRWRVSVETARGQIIGRAYLTIERVSTPRPTTAILQE